MGSNPALLLVDKKAGISSFVAQRKAKDVVDPKIGHTGTLDRFASGLMVLLAGSMTHLNALFSNLDKQYEATFRFGVRTDTLDPDGKVVEEGPPVDPALVERLIRERFTGDILQSPPLYSALHVDGLRASLRARKGEVLELPARPVRVYGWEVKELDGQHLSARISVSKGTYIRSLARDLAREAGSCGYVTTLRRVSVGPYRIEDAVGCDDGEGLVASVRRTGARLLELDCVRRMQAPEADWFLMTHGTCSRRLKACDGKDAAPYGAVYAGDCLRWVVDLARNRILCQIPEGLHEA